MISIPIVSEFDGKGISSAVEQFKQLEGAGAKAQFAIKKAAVPAAAALAGLAVALGDAVKGAMEDQQAAAKLAFQIRNLTGATDSQIQAVEDWISTQSLALGVADDELRPALARLVTQTHDVERAQRLLTLGMDIAAATGKPLSLVTEQIAKAAGGQEKALARLSPELKNMIADGADLDEVLGQLEYTFGGAATNAANTAEGGFKRLGVTMSETKESIGTALLPVIEKILPLLQKLADWASKHPTAFLTIAAAIGGVALAITAVNIAMAMNPFTLIAAGVAILIVGIVAAYKKFEWFRDGINVIINGIISYFEFMINGWIMVINAAIRAWNFVPGHKDIATIGHITLGRVGDSDNKASGGAAIPKMAEGGIVTSPTLALIGEAGPEAVVPLSKMGQMGGVTINVHGGDPNAVVDALRRYMRQNGSVPIRTAAIG
jgi:hypothetical protein